MLDGQFLLAFLESNLLKFNVSQVIFEFTAELGPLSVLNPRMLWISLEGMVL